MNCKQVPLNEVQAYWTHQRPTRTPSDVTLQVKRDYGVSLPVAMRFFTDRWHPVMEQYTFAALVSDECWGGGSFRTGAMALTAFSVWKTRSESPEEMAKRLAEHFGTGRNDGESVDHFLARLVQRFGLTSGGGSHTQGDDQ